MIEKLCVCVCVCMNARILIIFIRFVYWKKEKPWKSEGINVNILTVLKSVSIKKY